MAELTHLESQNPVELQLFVQPVHHQAHLFIIRLETQYLHLGKTITRNKFYAFVFFILTKIISLSAGDGFAKPSGLSLSINDDHCQGSGAAK